ncbi:hypothetical protein [Allobaculum mucilyticum]|uniref:hypothetical protein n=1 Tax=Allobaculum mucilyticum TaxID=2834459 RepID=UPI001E6238A7|nr:hypothetical protein [Allobaculum mucilyticum]UNT96682.1 hypothetical protein KWG62_02670 [Allobaculum mucilyticum]
MGKNWDYAEQSRKAKEAGGPEAYANQLEKRGYDLGCLDGDEKNAPKHQAEGALAIVALYGAWKAMVWCYHKATDYVEEKKRQREIIKEDISIQKKELIESLDDQGSDPDIDAESVDNSSNGEQREEVSSYTDLESDDTY